MPFNFPNAPTIGQIFEEYTWDGEKWIITGTPGGSTDSAGKLFPTRNSLMIATLPIDVTFALVAGYTSPGDRGGAMYKRVGAEPTHPGKLQTADGGWWEISAPFITPEMLGATGNGGTDDTLNINRADLVAAAKGVVLRFTSKIGYVVNGPDAAPISLRPSDNAHWQGDQYSGTTFWMASATTTAMIVDKAGVEVERIRFVSAGTRSSAAVNIYIDGHIVSSGFYLHDIAMSGAGIGIKTDGDNIVGICERISISASVANGVNFHIDGSFLFSIIDCLCVEEPDNPGPDVFANIFIKNVKGQLQLLNTSVMGASHPLYISPGDGDVVTLVKSDVCYYDSGVVEACRISASGTGLVHRVSFSDGWFSPRATASSTIIVDGSAASTPQNITQIDFNNNEIVGNTVSPYGVLIRAADRVTVRNNRIFGSAGSQLEITDSTNCIVSENTFPGSPGSGIVLAGSTARATVIGNDLAAPGTPVVNSASGANNRFFANQGYNGGSDLDVIEGITTSGLLTRTGLNTWSTRTITGAPDQVVVTNGGGVLANPIIGLASPMTFPHYNQPLGTGSNFAFLVSAGRTATSGTSDTTGVLSVNFTDNGTTSPLATMITRYIGTWGNPNNTTPYNSLLNTTAQVTAATGTIDGSQVGLTIFAGSLTNWTGFHALGVSGTPTNKAAFKADLGAGAIVQDDTIASTSPTTGALRVAGGAGIAGRLSLGDKLALKSFTVATLPAGSAAGETVFAANARMFNGAGVQEGAGVGTGGTVAWNGAAWKITGTNVTAVA